VTRPRNRRLDGLSWRIDRAANIDAEARQHLAYQNTLIGPLKAAGGTQRGSVGVYSDPTLAAVLAIDGCNTHYRAIDDAIATLEVCVNMLDAAYRDALAYHATPAAVAVPNAVLVPQCIGNVEVQGELVRCSRFVEDYIRGDGSVGYREGNLCAMHRKRAERERVA
jgi:hypothetical protein